MNSRLTPTSPPRLTVFDASRNQYSVIKKANRSEELKRHGIEAAASFRQARVVLGETRAQLRRAFLTGGPKGLFKTYFLYTEEPAYDRTTTKTAWLIQGLKRMHVMNVFTGDIFIDCSGFIPRFKLTLAPPMFDETDLRRRFQTKRGAAFITYRPALETRRVVQGRDVDLNARRIRVSLEGRKRGIVDIYGSGFPPGVSMSKNDWTETRPDEQWWDAKHRVLSRDYFFNLCFENTDWPGYITEKLWQSIRAGCLPVYQGKNNGISEMMPADSYIEASEFPEPGQLFDFIQSMSIDDYMGRLKKCHEAYSSLQNKWHAGETDTPAKRMSRLAARLHQAANSGR